LFRGGIIAEGLADVGESVDVSWAENEAAAELERVPSQLVLAVAGGFGAGSGGGVFGSEQVKEVRAAQAGGLVRFAIFINQERERDAGVFAEHSGVRAVAEADRGKGCSFLLKFGFVFAQLRGVLAAEDSAIVAKEDDDGGVVLP